MNQQNELENALLNVIEEYETRANDWENSLNGVERKTLLQVACDLEQLIWRHD
jgi:hypothetical protein